jgi:dihydroorotate dehydrogenase
MDLTTAYLGLKLKSPLVASFSPLTESLENIQHMEEAGAAAVVPPSIFEEQLTLENNALDRVSQVPNTIEHTTSVAFVCALDLLLEAYNYQRVAGI